MAAKAGGRRQGGRFIELVHSINAFRVPYMAATLTTTWTTLPVSAKSQPNVATTRCLNLNSSFKTGNDVLICMVNEHSIGEKAQESAVS